MTTATFHVGGKTWGDAKAPCSTDELSTEAPIRLAGNLADAVLAADGRGVVGLMLAGYTTALPFVREDLATDVATLDTLARVYEAPPTAR